MADPYWSSRTSEMIKFNADDHDKKYLIYPCCWKKGDDPDCNGQPHVAKLPKRPRLAELARKAIESRTNILRDISNTGNLGAGKGKGKDKEAPTGIKEPLTIPVKRFRT
ncbi:hypothetical protein K402DRAFT_395266, partial [Aulographum hederae CBS 113979]